jgi:hypothetical protein
VPASAASAVAGAEYTWQMIWWLKYDQELLVSNFSHRLQRWDGDQQPTGHDSQYLSSSPKLFAAFFTPIRTDAEKTDQGRDCT